MSLSIFLSHAWRDKNLAIVKQIENKLRGDGYEVWIDRHGIEYGEGITSKLDEALNGCDVVLVLWTENSHRSEACCHEIATAAKLGKPIVPCKLSEFEQPEIPGFQRSAGFRLTSVKPVRDPPPE